MSATHSTIGVLADLIVERGLEYRLEHLIDGEPGHSGRWYFEQTLERWDADCSERDSQRTANGA